MNMKPIRTVAPLFLAGTLAASAFADGNLRWQFETDG
jgi:hypothetical protein